MDYCNAYLTMANGIPSTLSFLIIVVVGSTGTFADNTFKCGRLIINGGTNQRPSTTLSVGANGTTFLMYFFHALTQRQVVLFLR